MIQPRCCMSNDECCRKFGEDFLEDVLHDWKYPLVMHNKCSIYLRCRYLNLVVFTFASIYQSNHEKRSLYELYWQKLTHIIHIPPFFCKAQMRTAEKWDRQGRSCQVVFQNCLSPSKSSPHQKHRCWCQLALDSLLGHFHFLRGHSSKEFSLFPQGLLRFIQKGKLPTLSR